MPSVPAGSPARWTAQAPRPLGPGRIRRGRARRVRRVLADQSLQLLVPAPELKAAVVEASDLGLQLLDLCLEPPDLIRQALNDTLLLIRVGRAAQSQPTKDIFKEPEQGARPTSVGLIDLPVHRIGQLAGHALTLTEGKNRDIERATEIVAFNESLVSPKSPLFASLYPIAE